MGTAIVLAEAAGFLSARARARACMGPAAHHVWEQAVTQDHGQVEHSTERAHALRQLEEVSGLLRDAHIQTGYHDLST